MFKSHESLSRKQIQSGLRWLYVEGIASLGFTSLFTSGFLASFALLLGANVFQVGFLSATPFIFQPLQLLFGPLTEAWRQRKLVSMAALSAMSLLWIPMALLPFADLSQAERVGGLMILASLQGILRALFVVNWNSWLRDLIPGPILGHAFAKRMLFGSISAILFGLATALFVDFWRTGGGGLPSHEELQGYTITLLVGVATLGLLSPLCIAKIPEIRMVRSSASSAAWLQGLRIPFRDVQFRRLLGFLCLRTFYFALVTPFFAVYMLQKLGYPISLVIAFTTLSQIANAWLLPLWGTFIGRFGAKAVMLASSSLMLLVLPTWFLLTIMDRGTMASEYLMYPVLAFCMILLGIATAGANIASEVMIMKGTQHNESKAYVSLASVAVNLGAGIGPLVGGRLVDVLLQRQLTFYMDWTGPFSSQDFTVLNLGGYEFLFLAAFLLGLFASNLLTHIQEGPYNSRDVVQTLVKNSADVVHTMNVLLGRRYLQIPLKLVRNIPGMDIVLGLTLYQVSNAVRLAMATSHYSSKSVGMLSLAVKTNLARLLYGQGNLEAYAEKIAYQAARGATHALWELETDPQLVLQGSLRGIAQELQGHLISPGSIKNARGALSGIVQGVIRGAHETQQDWKALTPAIYQASVEAAKEMGIGSVQADRIVRSAILYASIRLGQQQDKYGMAQLDAIPQQAFTY